MTEQSYFERAAIALERALQAKGFGEQAAYIDEALRLNRLALASEGPRVATEHRTFDPPTQSTTTTKARPDLALPSVGTSVCDQQLIECR